MGGERESKKNGELSELPRRPKPWVRVEHDSEGKIGRVGAGKRERPVPSATAYGEKEGVLKKRKKTQAKQKRFATRKFKTIKRGRM